jgi:nitrate/TMAO reductase-like tetraheme cytochrome c subunit
MCFFTKCINNKKDTTEKTELKSYASFAGSATCANCHKNIYDTHLNTAHFRTSALANDTNIIGSFEKGKNAFVYNEREKMVMEKRVDGFYQFAYVDNVEKKSQRFDMVIGSGTKGQSYATWTGSNLSQLPITYFTSAQQWSNSPGYPNRIALNRPITSRCLECHATFAEKLAVQESKSETFDKNKMILGVDCESCHGPAAKHVEFQTKNPTITTSKFIINPASFNRQQSLDMCAVCHGGRMQKTKQSFSFTAGDNLADYFAIDNKSADANSIDVHGNQYGMLKASKCFLKSGTMTCITCHNPHENEKGNVALFSQKCINCHNDTHKENGSCKMTAKLGPTINKDCITCHMPEQPSMAIAVMLQGKDVPTPALMHTHLIKVYSDETKAILDLIKNPGDNTKKALK